MSIAKSDTLIPQGTTEAFPNYPIVRDNHIQGGFRVILWNTGDYANAAAAVVALVPDNTPSNPLRKNGMIVRTISSAAAYADFQWNGTAFVSYIAPPSSFASTSATAAVTATNSGSGVVVRVQATGSGAGIDITSSTGAGIAVTSAGVGVSVASTATGISVSSLTNGVDSTGLAIGIKGTGGAETSGTGGKGLSGLGGAATTGTGGTGATVIGGAATGATGAGGHGIRGIGGNSTLSTAGSGVYGTAGVGVNGGAGATATAGVHGEGSASTNYGGYFRNTFGTALKVDGSATIDTFLFVDRVHLTDDGIQNGLNDNNVINKRNVMKSWGRIQITAGSPVVEAGFAISGAALAGVAPRTIEVTIPPNSILSSSTMALAFGNELNGAYSIRAVSTGITTFRILVYNSGGTQVDATTTGSGAIPGIPGGGNIVYHMMGIQS